MEIKKRIIIGCEFSGIVRSYFCALGYDAWSCDLLPTEDGGPHLQCDVREVLDKKWDLAIFHPPCTFLTNAGVRWLYKNGKGKERDPERWRNMEEAAKFFNELWNAPIRHICIENPIMHSYGRALISSSPSQTIQPWMFGHAETKATCLYLKNLPMLEPTNIIKPDFEKYPIRQQIRKDGSFAQGRGSGYIDLLAKKGGGFEPRVHYASPGPDRWKLRSRTLSGVAKALAEQYGPLLL